MTAPRTRLRLWPSTLAFAAAALCALASAQETRGLGRGEQELVSTLSSARRTGCGTVPGTTVPLRFVPALANAAARAARGEPPMIAARNAGYRATRIYHATLRGYDSTAAVAQSMAQHYCAALTNPELTGVGWHREGNAWWLMLAAPFTPPQPGDGGAVATRVLALTNEARAQRRLCGDRWFEPAMPLRYSATLERAARMHASEMAQYSYLQHAGRNGSSAGDRATQAGYAWRSIGENIASGQPTPDDAVRDWLRSPAHCAAIMSASFAEMGVAFAVNGDSESGIYWAQEFGRPR